MGGWGAIQTDTTPGAVATIVYDEVVNDSLVVR